MKSLLVYCKRSKRTFFWDIWQVLVQFCVLRSAIFLKLPQLYRLVSSGVDVNFFPHFSRPCAISGRSPHFFMQLAITSFQCFCGCPSGRSPTFFWSNTALVGCPLSNRSTFWYNFKRWVRSISSIWTKLPLSSTNQRYWRGLYGFFHGTTQAFLFQSSAVDLSPSLAAPKFRLHTLVLVGLQLRIHSASVFAAAFCFR